MNSEQYDPEKLEHQTPVFPVSESQGDDPEELFEYMDHIMHAGFGPEEDEEGKIDLTKIEPGFRESAKSLREFWKHK